MTVAAETDVAFHYPQSRAVVMGVCPNSDKETPVFGGSGSVSANRMESILPWWKDQAVGANAWWTKSEFTSARPSHIDQILDDTGCIVVIALGLEVQRELGVSEGPFYSWTIIEHDERNVHVLRFPHPSGLNRHWNKVGNRVVASDALADALTRR